MAIRFTPRLDILPAGQRRLWAELKDVPSGFTVYGGTALALRLGHRTSIDFDFFSADRLPAAMRRRLQDAVRGVDLERLPKVSGVR